MQAQAAQGGLTLENVKTTDYGCLKTAERAAINVEVSWMEWGPLSVTSAEVTLSGVRSYRRRGREYDLLTVEKNAEISLKMTQGCDIE